LLNGELITAAEAAAFELLITCDRGMRHRQNWKARTIAVLVLSTNNWRRIRRCRDRRAAAVISVGASTYTEIDIPETVS
jgi:hypothetical protein